MSKVTTATPGAPATPVRIVPANEVTLPDLLDVFGTGDYASRCRCQRLKVPGFIWRDSTLSQRTEMLREQTSCDSPAASATSGLVAFVRDEPAGWVAVEPRSAYPKLRGSRIPWTGRSEDKDDDTVWSVTCLIVRRKFRGQGLTYLMARATIDYARSRGARALEAYPMITQPGKEITWGELNVGAKQVFDEAGFALVTTPTARRVVMRVDFDETSASPRNSR